MYNNAQELIRATTRIHRADTTEDIASALVQAVMNGVPGSTSDWRLRIMARSAIAGLLRRLKLGHAQRHAASPEMAFDFRLDQRNAILRILRSCAGEVDEEHRQGLLHLAETAVQSVIGIRRGGDALRFAAEETRGKAPVAYASMGGSLFIPADVRAFAAERGLDGDDLTSHVAESAQPLRRACEADGVCRVGQLRFSRRIPDLDIVMRGSLDAAAQDDFGPIIRIHLLDARHDDCETPGTSPGMDGDIVRSTYSARLLRQLIG